MAKKYCSICGKELSIFHNRTEIEDGLVCDACIKNTGMSSEEFVEAMNSGGEIKDQIVAQIEKRRELLDVIANFTPTSKPASYAQFDDEKQLVILAETPQFRFKPENFTLFRYDQIVDYELIEDGESVAKGGIGRAAIGGLLFGSTGAIVGSTSRKQKAFCNLMQIKLTVKDYEKPAFFIEIIKSPVQKNNIVYTTILNEAQTVISQFQLVVKSNDEASASEVKSVAPMPQPMDTTEEIRKFKALLDDGIITQEEFDAKKKQLLGI